MTRLDLTLTSNDSGTDARRDSRVALDSATDQYSGK
jgi:hypothetical protein